MNLDFHYYGTYLAARVAGYESEEAQVIAYAAQYVDESEADMIDKKLLPGLRETMPTIESMGTLLGRNMDLICEEREIRGSERIWRSFHFLPGNIHEEDDRKVYTGERKYTRKFLGIHILGCPEYGKEEARAFSLMCQPNSVLSEKMVNDIRKHENKPYYLELLGIRMHVLADTWAHRYFSGTPSWWVNEAPANVYYVPGGKKMDYSILKDFSIKDFNKYMADNYFLSTPPMPSFRSFSYLGHGRMGAVPDVPFMHYKYKPQWSNEAVEKNNPEEFLLAFRQLIYAMSCIREQYHYGRNSYADINPDMEEALRRIFTNKEYKASEAADPWKELIATFYPREASLPDFDREKWKREAEGASEKGNTHYYHFNYAALRHQRYVTAYIERNSDMAFKESGNEKCVDNTDFVILKRTADSEQWQWASDWIQYLGHDRSRWKAQYKEGRFYLYYNGKRERCHTSDCLDYLGENGDKYRAVIEEQQDGSGAGKKWKLKIQNLTQQEELQEVSGMCYMAWNRKIYEMTLAPWENVDAAYLNNDFIKQDIQLFVCQREEEVTVSPKIHYLFARSDSKTEKQIFEFVLRQERMREFFRVNTDSDRSRNLIISRIDFTLDGRNNHILEIRDKELLIDRAENQEVLEIKDWDNKAVRLSMIDWLND